MITDRELVREICARMPEDFGTVAYLRRMKGLDNIGNVSHNPEHVTPQDRTNGEHHA